MIRGRNVARILQAVILLLLPMCNCQSTELRTFFIQDQRRNDLYFNGLIEHHCFNLKNNQRNYVRGTYGSYGYFEGRVDPNNSFLFHVNWYETSLTSLYGISGSATLNYNSSWNHVEGISWSGSSGDLSDSNSYKNWSSTNGSYITNDSTSSGSQILLEKCLYPGGNYEIPRDSVAILQDHSITSSSSDGLNTICQAPVGGFGLWFGTYSYEYSLAKDGVSGTETGNYGLNSLGFRLKSGIGFVGEWKAVTGPYSGDHGSNLYITQSISSSTVAIVGFYCFVSSSSALPATTRTQCESEYYEVIVDKNSKKYREGVDSCPSLYRQDDSFRSLFEYAGEGYQHRLHCGDAQHGGSTPWVLASVFILFSVILILTFIYMILVRKTPRAISPTN
jgi:hypothetical protein